MQKSLARKRAVKAAKRQPRSVGRSLLPPDDVGRVRGGRGRRRRCPPPRARCSSRIPYCVSQLLHNFFGLGVSESASAVARPSSRSLFCQPEVQGCLTCFCFVVNRCITGSKQNGMSNYLRFQSLGIILQRYFYASSSFFSSS